MSARERYYIPEQFAPLSSEPVFTELSGEYVRFALLGLQQFTNVSRWADREEFVSGYNGIVRLQWELLEDMSNQITQSIDRLYMMLDQAINGRSYIEEEMPDGQIVPFPALPIVPQVPADGIGLLPGLRRQLLNLQGNVNEGWFNGPARPATLADLAQAARVNGTQDEGVISDAIEEILGAGGNVGAIGTVLSNIFGTASDIATDGGLAAISIASSLANSVIAGAQGAQLDAVIAGLNLVVERLSYLTGYTQPDNNTIGSNGLPAWLSAGFGSVNELNGEGTYLLRKLGTIGDVIASQTVPMQQTAQATNTQLPIIATRLAQLLGIENVNDPVIGKSLLVLAECICDATNQIAENTAPPDEPPTFTDPGSCSNETPFETIGYWEYVTDGLPVEVYPNNFQPLLPNGYAPVVITDAANNVMAAMRYMNGENNLPGCARIVLPDGVDTNVPLTVWMRGYADPSGSDVGLSVVTSWGVSGPEAEGAMPRQSGSISIAYAPLLGVAVNGANVPAGVYRVYLYWLLS